MKKVIIIYGSTTGTTEKMSHEIEQEIKSLGLDTTVKKVSDMKPEELNEYEAIILGCSTWGDGELQQNFIGFEKKLQNLKLRGKKIAIFGPGESVYPQFCKAVDILEKTVKQCGAQLVTEGLKVDVIEGDFENQTRVWAKKIAQTLN